MSGQQSPFADALDQIVGNYNLKSKWYSFSRDRLSVEGARVLVQQWGIFNRHSRRCWAYVVGNCPHMELRKFIVGENLYEEEAIEGRSHFDLLLSLGKNIGLTADEIWHAKPLPTTVLALHTWETLTKNRTWYEGATAKVTLERTNKPKGGNFSAVQTENWMRHLGLSLEEVEFWTLHDSVDQIHSDGTVELLEKYMTADSEKEAALQAAEDSMIAWKFYLDGIAEAGNEKTKP
jgi:pyrroloquinoline quinone (PQQ) biosynthesis protein C